MKAFLSGTLIPKITNGTGQKSDSKTPTTGKKWLARNKTTDRATNKDDSTNALVSLI